MAVVIPRPILMSRTIVTTPPTAGSIPGGQIRSTSSATRSAIIVEGGNNSVEESPAFEIWKDSKWIEFYQYDLYMALGLRNDAQRIYQKWFNQTDDFPRPGTHWFRDFFYPLWRDHGHAKVMVNFFELVAKYFPRGPYGSDKHPRYTRRMNWGEFIHFMSGAAHKDLRPLARRAFGWPAEWTDLYKKAREDFPEIKYKT